MPRNPLGHSNGFDDDYDQVVRSNIGGDKGGLEDGPGGLFPAGGGPYPSNSGFGEAYDKFCGRSHDWMTGLGGGDTGKDYE